MELLTSILRGSFGIAVLLGICYLLSADRSKINWRLVSVGVGLQLALALLLKIPFISRIFDGIASFFVVVLDFTEKGAEFVQFVQIQPI